MEKNKKETLEQKRKQVRDMFGTFLAGLKVIGIVAVAVGIFALVVVLIGILLKIMVGRIILIIVVLICAIYFIGSIYQQSKRSALGPPSEFEQYIDRMDKKSKKSSKANESKRNT